MISRFLLGILVLSLIWSAVGSGETVIIPPPPVASSDGFWPVEVSQCDNFRPQTCQFLLCLCFVNSTAAKTSQPDELNQQRCSAQFNSCQKEAPPPAKL